MAENVKVVIRGGEKVYKCRICGREYYVRNSAANHVKRKHPEVLGR
jgi:uncharacterized C2H2 Zn-finger protein